MEVPPGRVSIYDVFTPVSVMRDEEPEFFRPSAPSVVRPRASVEETDPNLPKTPVAVLHEGCLKVYNEPPTYTTMFDGIVNNAPKFEVQCYISGVKQLGAGRTKKLAKHAASVLALKEIVKKGRHTEMGLGDTEEAAYKFIDKLALAVKEDIGGASSVDVSTGAAVAPVTNENWVGKIQEMCQKNKIDAPRYNDEANGPPNDRVFKCFCMVGSSKTEGTGKTKKAAKTEAARKMFTVLETSIHEMEKELNLEDNDDSDSEDVPEESPELQAARIDPNPRETMEKILSNEEIFTKKNVEFKPLTTADVNGHIQVLLRISFHATGDAMERRLVFPGTGESVEAAERNASRAALINICTYAPATATK